MDGSRFRAEHRIVAASDKSEGTICFQSSGIPLPGVMVRIVSDQGNALEDGHVGEIHIQSDTLFAGYFNRPDLTAEAIVDGWYRTGDLGFFLAGELFVVGRKKDLLIVGGENIYPQDIEEIVGGHPAIHEGRVVAMGVFNPNLGTDDIVVAAEVQREQMLTHAHEIEKELRDLIVAATGLAVKMIYLKPTKWIVKSTAGKAARSATREKLLSEHPELNHTIEESRFS